MKNKRLTQITHQMLKVKNKIKSMVQYYNNNIKIKQECSLSLKLFNIYVEQYSINEIKETFTRDKIEVIVGEEFISFLRFADDIALVASSENYLKRVLEEITRCFQIYHLKINWN